MTKRKYANVKKYRIVVRDECVYEKEISARNDFEAGNEAINDIAAIGFSKWMPITKPQTTIVSVTEVKE